jgi:hypothetical protein
MFVKMVSPRPNKSFSSLPRSFMESREVSPTRKGEEDNGTSLDFDKFVKIIEKIAQKLYPDLAEEQALNAIVDLHLYRLIDEKKLLMKNIDTKSHLKKLMQILKEPSVVDILGKLKKALHHLYNFYADEGGLIDSDRFLKFCRDFEIFPHVLPRGKIMQLFYNLASLYPFLTK